MLVLDRTPVCGQTRPYPSLRMGRLQLLGFQSHNGGMDFPERADLSRAASQPYRAVIKIQESQPDDIGGQRLR